METRGTSSCGFEIRTHVRRPWCGFRDLDQKETPQGGFSAVAIASRSAHSPLCRWYRPLNNRWGQSMNQFSDWIEAPAKQIDLDQGWWHYSVSWEASSPAHSPRTYRSTSPMVHPCKCFPVTWLWWTWASVRNQSVWLNWSALQCGWEHLQRQMNSPWFQMRLRCCTSSRA